MDGHENPSAGGALAAALSRDLEQGLHRGGIAATERVEAGVFLAHLGGRVLRVRVDDVTDAPAGGS